MARLQALASLARASCKDSLCARIIPFVPVLIFPYPVVVKCPVQIQQPLSSYCVMLVEVDDWISRLWTSLH